MKNSISYNGYTIIRTRFEELGYTHVAPGLWRFVDITEFPRDKWAGLPVVGPHYGTKAELLADMERYYAACWASV